MRSATTTCAVQMGDSSAARMKASASSKERKRIRSGGNGSFPTAGATPFLRCRPVQRRLSMPLVPMTALLETAGVVPTMLPTTGGGVGVARR